MTRHGLTLAEVVIAMAVVAVAFTILSTALVFNLQVTGTSGARTQTTQYLNYLGRLVAGGNVDVLPPAGGTLTWDYGAMATAIAFADLPGGSGWEAADRYRASVEHVGVVTFAGAEGVQYRVTVCSMTPNGESCTVGVTIGPERLAGGGGLPPLPGIN